jgi:hypothetical protein
MTRFLLIAIAATIAASMAAQQNMEEFQAADASCSGTATKTMVYTYCDIGEDCNATTANATTPTSTEPEPEAVAGGKCVTVEETGKPVVYQRWYFGCFTTTKTIPTTATTTKVSTTAGETTTTESTSTKNTSIGSTSTEPSTTTEATTTWVEIYVSTCSDKICLANCQDVGTYRISAAEFAMLETGSCFNWRWTPNGGAESQKVGKSSSAVDLVELSCGTSTSTTEKALLAGSRATTAFALVGLAFFAIFF